MNKCENCMFARKFSEEHVGCEYFTNMAYDNKIDNVGFLKEHITDVDLENVGFGWYSCNEIPDQTIGDYRKRRNGICVGRSMTCDNHIESPYKDRLPDELIIWCD